MSWHHQQRNADRDRGLTLVEVIVTVALLGLMSSVIAAAVMVVFRSQDGIVASTAESHDTRQIVNYLPLDVASGPSRADAYRATIGAAGDRGSGCSDAGNDNVLRIDITSRRPADLLERRIAYRLDSTGVSARIDRYLCTRATADDPWVEEVLNVADFLDSSVLPVAEVSVVNPTADSADQEVASVQLRYVQRGVTESITASPREEQPLSTGGVCGSDPLSATRNMATFVQGDVVLHGTAVKSSLFVGGELTFHGGTVAHAVPDAPASPVPATVGLLAGSIDWGGSSGQLEVQPHWGVVIEDGEYWVDGNRITQATPGTSPALGIGSSATVIPPGPAPLIVPGEAFADLRACSDRLAGLPDTCNNGECAVFTGLPSGYPGTATATGNQLRLDLTSGKANAFNIDVSNLQDLDDIQLQFSGPTSPSAATPLIINVRSTIGGTVDFEAPSIQGAGTNAVYIIWNFPNADFVNVQAGDRVYGTVMAPYASVTSYADIEGGVVAREFEMFGSSLNDVRSFDGVLGW